VYDVVQVAAYVAFLVGLILERRTSYSEIIYISSHALKSKNIFVHTSYPKKLLEKFQWRMKMVTLAPIRDPLGEDECIDAVASDPRLPPPWQCELLNTRVHRTQIFSNGDACKGHLTRVASNGGLKELNQQTADSGEI